MWSAIRGDILEFVNTIQTDVSSALSEHLNERAERNGTTYAEELANSRATFEEEVHNHEYKEFRKAFRLNEYASDIARLLGSSKNSVDCMLGDGSVVTSSCGESEGDEEETETAQFLAEMVPSKMSKEEFWARYYFRLSKLPRPPSRDRLAKGAISKGGTKNNSSSSSGVGSGNNANSGRCNSLGEYNKRGNNQKQPQNHLAQRPSHSTDNENDVDEDEDEENIPWDDGENDDDEDEVAAVVPSVAAAINAASSEEEGVNDGDHDNDYAAGAQNALPLSVSAAQNRDDSNASNTSSNSDDSARNGNKNNSERPHHNSRMTMSGMQMIEVNAYDYNTLMNANSQMKKTIKELKQRVADLEAELATAHRKGSSAVAACGAVSAANAAAVATTKQAPATPQTSKFTNMPTKTSPSTGTSAAAAKATSTSVSSNASNSRSRSSSANAMSPSSSSSSSLISSAVGVEESVSSGSASPTNSTHSSLVHVSSTEFNPAATATAAAAIANSATGGGGRHQVSKPVASSVAAALEDDEMDDEDEDEETWA